MGASGAPAAAQQAQPVGPVGRTGDTALAGGAPGERDYPDGSGLQVEYQTFAGSIPLPEPRTGERTMATFGFSASLEIQAGLPQGFTLDAGNSARVMDNLPEPTAQSQPAGPGQLSLGADVTRAPGPSASVAEAAEEGASQRTQAKYITLYPVKYQSIPLSKGSDMLSIVSADGVLLATRERSLRGWTRPSRRYRRRRRSRRCGQASGGSRGSAGPSERAAARDLGRRPAVRAPYLDIYRKVAVARQSRRAAISGRGRRRA